MVNSLSMQYRRGEKKLDSYIQLSDDERHSQQHIKKMIRKMEQSIIKNLEELGYVDKK